LNGSERQGPVVEIRFRRLVFEHHHPARGSSTQDRVGSHGRPVGRNFQLVLGAASRSAFADARSVGHRLSRLDPGHPTLTSLLGALVFQLLVGLRGRRGSRGRGGHRRLFLEGGLSQDNNLGVVLAELAVSLSSGVSSDSGARKGQLVAADNADQRILVVVGRRRVVREIFEIEVIQRRRQRLAVAVGLEHDGGVFRRGMGGVRGIVIEFERPRMGLGRSIDLAHPADLDGRALSSVLAVFNATGYGFALAGLTAADLHVRAAGNGTDLAASAAPSDGRQPSGRFHRIDFGNFARGVCHHRRSIFFAAIRSFRICSLGIRAGCVGLIRHLRDGSLHHLMFGGSTAHSDDVSVSMSLSQG